MSFRFLPVRPVSTVILTVIGCSAAMVQANSGVVIKAENPNERSSVKVDKQAENIGSSVSVARGQMQDGLKKAHSIVSVEVEKNGRVYQVPLEGTLEVIRGESFKVLRTLGPGSHLVHAVNVVGFGNGSKTNKEDDRGFLVDSLRLVPRWSVDSAGRLFRLKVKSANKNLGDAYIRLVDPKVDYVTVEVDGESRILRSQDILRINATQDFRIGKVGTNLGRTSQIDVSVLEVESPALKGEKVKPFEIRIAYRKQVIARLPVLVKGM